MEEMMSESKRDQDHDDEPPSAQILDLFEALKRALEKSPPPDEPVDRPCPGIEIATGSGAYSGCDASAGDCPRCGK
jgi:hypothetical protein